MRKNKLDDFEIDSDDFPLFNDTYEVADFYVTCYGAIKKDYLKELVLKSGVKVNKNDLDDYIKETCHKGDVISDDYLNLEKYYKIAKNADINDYKVFKNNDYEETYQFIRFTMCLVISNCLSDYNGFSMEDVFEVDSISNDIIESMFNGDNYFLDTYDNLKRYKLDASRMKLLLMILGDFNYLIPKRSLLGYSELEKVGFSNKNIRLKLIKEFNNEFSLDNLLSDYEI